MSDPNKKGAEFEDRVEKLLGGLAASYPKLVKLDKPTIPLQNGETVKPDFHLAIEFAHEHRNYLFECQHRQKTSKDIHHKIQYIRNKYWLKTFIFLYPDSLAEEPKRAMAAEGIMHMNFSDLELWVRRVSAALAVQPEVEPERGKVEAPMLLPVLSSKMPWTTRIVRPVRRFFRIARALLILAGLLTVIDYALPLLVPRSGLGGNVLMTYNVAKDAVSDSVTPIFYGRPRPEEAKRRRIERARRNLEVDILGALSKLKINLGKIAWNYDGTNDDTELNVLIPHTDELTLLMTEVNLPTIEKNVWNLTEEPDEETLKAMQVNTLELKRKGQSAVESRLDYHIFSELRWLPRSGVFNPEWFLRSRDAETIPSDQEFINFCTKAAKSLAEVESTCILGSYQFGDHWVLLCELRAPSAPPVQVLYHNPPLKIISWEINNGVVNRQSRFELIMPPSAWDIEAARSRLKSNSGSTQ
jgi:hypothetical protein